jgi:sodium-dependent dicarboxylate transporter 2/3/5
MIVFGVTVALWLIRPQLAAINFGSAVEPWLPLKLLSDTGIVMVTAILLFLIPAGWSATGHRQFVMDWETAKQLPWNVLLLFGGGLSLAAAVKNNGVTEFLGSQLVFLSGKPEWLVVLVVTAVVVFMTELTSNTATTASLVPVLAALAVVVGIHPLILVVAAGISASCAFMLPVATPPNAIVYGSGCISMAQMARSGFLLNLISVAVITFFVLNFSGMLLEPATR